MTGFNPLKDKFKKKSTELTASEELEASANGPLSPISGRPMQLVKCRDVPCWVDLNNRLVLPLKVGQ